MNKKVSRSKSRKGVRGKNAPKPISYHLNCAKTANGLSHFIMYGDAPKKQSLV